jgi:hypothetical protein
MWVLNLSKYYFCSYHPELKPLIIEVKRDEELMEAAGEILISAAKLVITETEKLNDQQICHINER